MAVLPRIQFIELEDLAWFPRIVRDYGTDYLQFIQERFQLHRPMLPLVEKALRRSGVRRIVDLGSGGGGPITGIHAALQDAGEPVAITLTDLYPNRSALERIASHSGGAIDWVESPIDARAVPCELRGLRTMFNAFHHFAPRDGRKILADAVRARAPIAVLEISHRSVGQVLSILLGPLVVLAVTPLIRPFTWRRLLLTYLFPAVPTICLWDGVVSQLRAYTAAELAGLAREVDAESYDWESGCFPLRPFPGRGTYLLGLPKLEAEEK